MSAVDWAATCSCGCPARGHYADDGHFQCVKHMKLGDHEPPRRRKGAMSRKSWAETKVDDCIRRGVACPCSSCRSNYLRALTETIEECARQADTWLYSIDAKRAILALLEPGDEETP